MVNNQIKSILKKVIGCTFSIYFSTLLSAANLHSEKGMLTIGFGSCADQRNEQPIWDKIGSHNPDLFIFAGDNVYVDSSNNSKFAEAYAKLSANEHFAKFKKDTPIIGTWDDHDYGTGDGGKGFVAREASKAALINFFNYPELNQLIDKDRGIYHTKWLDYNNKKVQIILMDTRWYRDQPKVSYLTTKQRKKLNLGPYQPNLDTNTTILGTEQWAWLEAELQKPADLRLIVSSIQFLNEFSGYETWANFPHERERLLALLYKYTKTNMMILSGDIHKAEISEFAYKDRTFVEATSSGLSVYIYPKSENMHKVGETLEERNYMMLKIQGDNSLNVEATIYNDKGEAKLVAKTVVNQ